MKQMLQFCTPPRPTTRTGTNIIEEYIPLKPHLSMKMLYCWLGGSRVLGSYHGYCLDRKTELRNLQECSSSAAVLKSGRIVYSMERKANPIIANILIIVIEAKPKAKN